MKKSELEGLIRSFLDRTTGPSKDDLEPAVMSRFLDWIDMVAPPRLRVTITIDGRTYEQLELDIFPALELPQSKDVTESVTDGDYCNWTVTLIERINNE